MTIEMIQILKQTETLSAGEKLRLAELLIEQARQKLETVAAPRKWLDLIGAVPYPMMGEDAQAWVSRTRQEGDDEREKQWSRNE